MMPGAIRSSRMSTSLNKTEEMHKKTREAKGKMERRHAPHWTLLSPVDTAHDRAFPALGSSAMSVPAVDLDRLPNLRSGSQAIIINNTFANNKNVYIMNL